MAPAFQMKQAVDKEESGEIRVGEAEGRRLLFRLGEADDDLAAVIAGAVREHIWRIGLLAERLIEAERLGGRHESE